MSAVDFTTYFGDYFLGMFVHWTADASTSSGTTRMNIEMTMNMRSKLHVYGYSGDLTDAANPITFSTPPTNFVPDVATTWEDSTRGLYNKYINYCEVIGTHASDTNNYPYDAT